LKAYRGLFIFSGSLDDDALGSVLERVKEEIKRLNGQVTDTEMLGKRAFARQLGKKTAGIYVVIHFRIEPEQAAALPARLKLNEDVFRSQILEVDKEPPRKGSESKGGNADGQS
jgi:ribosomal protein S6